MKLSKMFKKIGAAALAFVIASSSVVLTVSAAGRTPDGMISQVFDMSYFYYHVTSESLISTTKDAKLIKYIKNSLMNYEEKIDLSEFKINSEELENLVNIVNEVYPELFFVSPGTCIYNGGNNLVSYYLPKYLYVDANGKPNKQKINSMLKEFYAEADYYLKMVNDKSVYKDDLSKAMLLHDEIALDMHYDISNHSNYTFAIDKYGLCENYAQLYAYLLGQLGIKTELVNSVFSGDSGHQWMKICLDGKWYNIDPTWDDPTLDEPGKVPHEYFLLSDSKFSQIDDSGLHSGYMTLHASNDKKYDNYKIHNYNSKLCKVNANDKIVYAVDNENKKIVKYNYATNKETTIVNLSGYKWSGGSGQNYVDSLTSLEAYGGYLFYNSPRGIYRYNIATGKSELLYVPKNSSDQFFGLRIKGDNLYSIIGKYSPYDVDMVYVGKVTVKNKTVNPTSIKLSKTSVSLTKGKTTTLKATVNPSNATNKKVTWTTSNSKVATVSNGKITAKGAGTATITAKTVNGKKATCKVTVKNNKTVNPTSIKLSKKSVSLTKGKTTTLKATVNPSNATNKKVTWTTSNSKVATVSNGKITAKSAGTATITAKTVNGKKATCKVTVKNNKTVNPTSIKLSKKSVSLTKGKTTTLKATVNPSNATNKKVTWSTSNSRVATVSNGKITAKSAGTATITAKTANGKKATCKVTVKNKTVNPTSIKLSKTSVSLTKGKTITLKATVNSSNATNKKVTWTTSNSKVATVSNGKITAKGAGTATITAKTANGKKAACKVTVKNKTVNPTSIKLSKTSVSLTKGKTITLKATVNPSNATNKKVTWTTSNSKVATVSNGKITGKGAGTATITAKTANGKKATCKVTVKSAVNYGKYAGNINLSTGGISVSTIFCGKGYYYNIIVNGYYKKLKCSTTDTNVAYLTNDLKLITNGVGTATITFETESGLIGVCNITVQ